MKTIAIIGGGPRGLHALESLLKVLAKKEKSIPQILIFEREKKLGSGQVWDSNQTNINQLNISQRALKNLGGRESIHFPSFKIPAFQSYISWLPEDEKNSRLSDADLFPPRAKMGAYLEERFQSIAAILEQQNILKIVNEKVRSIKAIKNKFSIHADAIYSSNEVLLTIGHQKTKNDDQLQTWVTHANKSESTLFELIYPSEKVINSKEINQESAVALRGFGLATLDAIKALTAARGGKFEILNSKTCQSKFIPSKNTPKKIIPFSLDGLPMIPKPLNAKLDQYFKPSASELQQLEDEISAYSTGKTPSKDIQFLHSAMSKITGLQYSKHTSKYNTSITNSALVRELINSYLTGKEVNHPAFYNYSKSTNEIIEDFIGMALGNKPFSLDYGLGQVWRHCQPSLYRLFSHCNLSDEQMSSVVALDEKMKRYAYGPPVESIQQLLALYNCGVLTFDFVNNPEIELTKKGWVLKNKQNKIACNVMINCILDAPKLLEVKSDLITTLLADDLLKPVHSELGIKTEKNGIVVLNSGQQIPLAAIGRLCKGSVLGVDAILECFSPEAENWAKGVINRLKN